MQTPKNSWFKMEATGPKTAELSIYGEVGYWPDDASTFRRALKGLGEVEKIDLRLNSPGGSVIDGWAIFNQLVEHPATITAHIDGWAASMASIIAMAADEVIMPSNTWFMIHNPWTTAAGESGDLRRMADVMDSMKGHAVKAYQRHIDADAETISGWMDAETWMAGEDAKGLGFRFTVTDPMEIAASVTHRLENVPDAAMAWVAKDEVEEEAEEEEAAPDVSETDDADTDETVTTDEPEEPAADDAAYDEGKTAGVAEGRAAAVTELKVEQAKLTTKQAEMAAEIERLSGEVESSKQEAEEARSSLAESTAKLAKLLPGLGAPPIKEIQQSGWLNAIKAKQEKGMAYNDAFDACSKEFPALLVEFRTSK